MRIELRYTLAGRERAVEFERDTLEAAVALAMERVAMIEDAGGRAAFRIVDGDQTLMQYTTLCDSTDVVARLVPMMEEVFGAI